MHFSVLEGFSEGLPPLVIALKMHNFYVRIDSRTKKIVTVMKRLGKRHIDWDSIVTVEEWFNK